MPTALRAGIAAASASSATCIQPIGGFGAAIFTFGDEKAS
jgi:hypothetical protein